MSNLLQTINVGATVNHVLSAVHTVGDVDDLSSEGWRQVRDALKTFARDNEGPKGEAILQILGALHTLRVWTALAARVPG